MLNVFRDVRFEVVEDSRRAPASQNDAYDIGLPDRLVGDDAGDGDDYYDEEREEVGAGKVDSMGNTIETEDEEEGGDPDGNGGGDNSESLK